MENYLSMFRERIQKSPFLSTLLATYLGVYAERGGYVWQIVKVLFVT